MLHFFMTPKARIKFLVNFLFLAHCVAFGRLVSELQWIFFSGHFGEEGGRFISQKSLKQVFSAPSLSGFLWVFWVVPTVFIWVFMWILIISCKKSAYFTFGARILHWKLLKILENQIFSLLWSKVFQLQCNMWAPNLKYRIRSNAAPGSFCSIWVFEWGSIQKVP